LIAAGQSIGNYRILSKIGTGGMGAVYLAEHPLIGKKVALKVIHRDLANNKEVVQRFFQEAKAVNKIGNEHIIEIHDFGVSPEGDHFYIMEYLEGQTLAQLLSRDRVIETVRALHIGAQISSALGAAHASGVIHRDLKPDNVMLTMRLGDPDFVKLLDFGLAKLFSAGPSAVKTAAGVLLGTPQYMSPEACESRPGLDHRTDVYAVGILLFQMVTGQLPFDGESMGEVLVKQVTQLPPPPRALNPQIAPSVEQIVLRCLMKSPDQRFQTMAALREALLDPEKYLMQSPPIAPARSLAPGASPVDAKTVMQYAAEQSRTKMLGGAGGGGGNANMAKTSIGAVGPMAAPMPMQRGGGPQLPLPAPPMTAPGNHGLKTMLASDPIQAPRAPSMPMQVPQIAVPEMAAPAQPKMNTMRIATPLGYSSRPPRRVWPFVLVAGLVLGLGGGAFAVAWFGRENGEEAAGSGSAGSASGSGSATAKAGSGSAQGSAVKMTATPGSAAPGSAGSAGSAVVQAPTPPPPPPPQAGSGAGTGSAAKGSGAAKPAHTALVEILSEPPGAEVYTSDKLLLGKTPTKIDLPISDMPISLELVLPGYKKKTKQIVVSKNTIVDVPLEKAPAAVNTGNTGGNHKKQPDGATGLMRPEDL
jgi:tRNA A-37 threonylcarbamoyl transferase component Bud32